MSYLVLHVRPFDFESEDGKQVQGSSVTYLDLSSSAESGEVGIPPLRMSVTQDVGRTFSHAPGIYNLDFRHRPGRGGKPVLVLVGAELQKRVSLGTPENQATT